MTDPLAQPVSNTDNTEDREAGFSLLEIMIAVVIIGIMGTIVLLNVLPAQDQAMVQKARTDIATLEQALDAYRMDMREYPSSEAGLNALVTPPREADASRFREGGYIRRLQDDPWGNPYQYVYPGQNGMIDIFSLGRDGREGGEGLDADIGNWQG